MATQSDLSKIEYIALMLLSCGKITKNKHYDRFTVATYTRLVSLGLARVVIDSVNYITFEYVEAN